MPTEGDGAILTYKGRPTFVITPKETEILLHIQKVLGFGIVREYKSFSRYFLLDKQNIYILTLLFNGNLVLEHRKSQLSYWIQALNKTFASKKPALKIQQSLLCLWATGKRWTVDLSEINLIDKLIKPTLKDAWLSGFTDAEGCFKVKIDKFSNSLTGFRVMLRFILDHQKSQYLFLQLRDLFYYGAVSLRAGKASIGVYRYQVNSFKGLIPIRNYFLNFPLKSKKLLSFKKWNEIYKMVLNKEHLLEKGLTAIRELYKIIIRNKSLNRKTGSAKPK